jgi:hypothetical protein
LRATRFVLVPALLLIAGASHADDWYGFAGIGPAATAEAGVGKVINDHWSLRAGLGRTHGTSSTRSIGGIGYDVKPEADTTLSVLADWFPMSGSGFRLSGGLTYSSRQSVGVTAATGADGAYHLNGNSYSSADVGSLAGQVTFRKVEPYVGVGWESAPANKPGWRFMADLGLHIQQGAKTSLSTTGGQSIAALQQDVAAARKQLADDFSGTRFRLGMSLGLGFSF